LYSWGGKLSISFRFRKLFQIKAPQVGAFVFEKRGFQKPNGGAARLLKKRMLDKTREIRV